MTSDDRLHVFRETNFTNIFMKMISQSDYKSYTGCYEFKNGCHCCSLIPR